MNSEARLILNIAIVALFPIAIISVSIYAWLRGRSAERFGSLLYAAAFMTAMALYITLGLERSVVPVLLLDAFAALGFLVLAFRYNSLWLGLAMILQGIVLGLHSTHLTEVEDPQVFGMSLYATLQNLISLGMLATFAGATALAQRERRRRLAQTAGPQSGPSAGAGANPAALPAGFA